MKDRFVININVFGDVQAGNLQIIQGASITENVGTKRNKGIFKKLFQIIGVIIKFLAAMLTTLHYLGLLDK